ncbi:MAG: hypothetical protein JW810_01815 [Sedimentisphaerales bacterium]|nr:hypothetical protein [Sedimentisphaerales bacterium]
MRPTDKQPGKAATGPATHLATGLATGRRPRRGRQGSIYMLVLVSTVVLVGLVLGLSYRLLHLHQLNRSQRDMDRAFVYAELGVRHALHYTRVDPQWRVNLTSGPWLQDVAVDQAVYSVSGIDAADGDLANVPSEPVTLSCTAAIGGVTRQVQVEAKVVPLELLKYAASAADDMSISNHVRVYGSITCNDDISKSGSDTWVFGDAEAVDTIYETTNISGTVAPGSPPKQYPDSSALLAYYTARATPIPYSSTIQSMLISPANNPWGSPNPDGLYKIQCGYQKIEIRNCRIVGTLLLINPRSDSLVSTSINWTPARADYPALIVDGSFTISPTKDLREYEIGYVDLNLPGESGYGSVWTVFSNRISGLVYCTGDLTLEDEARIEGAAIVQDDLFLQEDARCTLDEGLYDNPPVYFHYPYLQAVRGAWQETIP